MTIHVLDKTDPIPEVLATNVATISLCIGMDEFVHFQPLLGGESLFAVLAVEAQDVFRPMLVVFGVSCCLKVAAFRRAFQ